MSSVFFFLSLKYFFFTIYANTDTFITESYWLGWGLLIWEFGCFQELGKNVNAILLRDTTYNFISNEWLFQKAFLLFFQ